MSLPALSDLFRRVVSETAEISRAMGVGLAPEIEEKTWAMAKQLPAVMRASTAIDLEKGLPLEIEWGSGAAARLAAKSGVSVPVNETLNAFLLPYKNGKS